MTLLCSAGMKPGSHADDTEEADAAIEIRHLRAFVAVAQKLSFTHAAEHLNMTQPALSRTIAQLERRLGRSLLNRSRQSVEISDAGVLFLPYARRTLATLAEGVTALTNERVVLRVGFTWGAASRHIGPIVRAFEKTHPHVEVPIRRFDTTLAGLADGRSHLGFLPGQIVDAHLGSFVLAQEPRVAAVPVDHRLASLESLKLSDLAYEPIVINVVSGTTSLELWPPGERPQKVVRVRNVDEWLEAVAAGRGVGLSAASTGQLYTHPQIVYRYIDDAPPVPITLVWRLGEEHRLVSEFVATARSLQQVEPLEFPTSAGTSSAPAPRKL